MHQIGKKISKQTFSIKSDLVATVLRLTSLRSGTQHATNTGTGETRVSSTSPLHMLIYSYYCDVFKKYIFCYYLKPAFFAHCLLVTYLTTNSLHSEKIPRGEGFFWGEFSLERGLILGGSYF